MLIPPVSHYMTSSPHVVAPGDSLFAVRDLMREYDVQHVPVVAAGQLVGLVTDQDVTGSYAADDTARDAMTAEPPTVRADAPLDVAVTRMQAGRECCVVIVGDAGVEGIFTRSDAMRALCDLLAAPPTITPAPPPARTVAATVRLMRRRGAYATR